MVRAKFIVSEKLQSGVDMFKITLIPVTYGSPENNQFYKWTPGGKIELQTINAQAADQFVVGEAYYVYFERSESVDSAECLGNATV